MELGLGFGCIYLFIVDDGVVIVLRGLLHVFLKEYWRY